MLKVRPNVAVDDMKFCFVCGENTNKMKRHERYNHITSIKKKGKFQKDEDSNSDSDDSSSKSKKKTPQRSSARAPAAGSRQTRNQNPKSYAGSLCKVMELPDTADEPFLQIFSRGHYCNECTARVKDAHTAQVELERIQARINELKVDFEIDFSKHLERLPARKNFYNNNPAVALYEEDIKLILDFHGTEKKGKTVKKEKAQPKRERRQAAINSSAKMKRKLEESESEEEESEEEEVEQVKVKEKRSKKGNVVDAEVSPENSSPVTEKEEKDEPAATADSIAEAEIEDVKEEEESPGIDEKDANNGSSEVKQEVKPEEIVKTKKDPNLKCPHCPIPRYFNIAANLEEHITKCHNYNCDACDKTFQFEVALKKHKAHAHVHKTTAEGAEGKFAYICGFCDQEFQVKKYLEDHLDRHQEAKPLNCHQCGRGFSRKESLQKAFQIFKGESVEACNRCGKNLNLKDYIEHNKNLKQQ